MNKKWLVILGALLAMALPAAAFSPEEVYRKARLRSMKAGEWAEYELTIEIPAIKSKIIKRRRITVVGIDRSAVKFQQVDTSGTTIEKSESSIAFKDKTKRTHDIDIRQEVQGSEQLTIDGKEYYNVDWFEAENRTQLQGQAATVVDKTWYSDEVPVFGELKRVFTATTNTITITTEVLRASGKAP